jgi:hypothetical protein
MTGWLGKKEVGLDLTGREKVNFDLSERLGMKEVSFGLT